ncbi:MAG: hypothetical protein M1818_004181 [Claussenomyces sp. TS43310]|nr:MAG: hypothetical protein M1818_004181 [Claussenomyces sp. TS43310]
MGGEPREEVGAFTTQQACLQIPAPIPTCRSYSGHGHEGPSAREVSQDRIPRSAHSYDEEEASGHQDFKNPIASCSIAPEPSPEVATAYPEGGLQAWLVVWGSWCAMTAALGIANSVAVFQSYVLRNQLKTYDAGTVGWIFSLYAFLAFACGLVIGPVFDKHGPRWLVLAGSVGVSLKYWHFIIVFGVIGGVGTSLLFTPSIAAIGHYFHRRRGNATGIAATGGAVGGVVFPLMLQALIPKIGFAWACRVMGFIFIALCANACIFIRTRLPPKEGANAKPDFRIFKNPVFAILVGGVYLIEWALFIPLSYISSYALAYGFSEAFSYHILVILNAGSILGRFIPGFYADKIGRFNSAILTLLLSVISVLAIWIPAGRSEAGLIVFALLLGFASGSNISLTPVCVGQLCETEEYGRYYATCYTVVSVGCLTGIPIAGEIISADHGEYWGLKLWVAAFPSSGAFDLINSALTSDDAERKNAIKQGNAVFALTLKNKAGETESWNIDLKKKGDVGKGAGDEPTVTLSLSDDDFGKLVSGKANAQRLFMAGKLKVKGDVMKATKLESVFAKIRPPASKL